MMPMQLMIIMMMVVVMVMTMVTTTTIHGLWCVLAIWTLAKYSPTVIYTDRYICLRQLSGDSRELFTGKCMSRNPRISIVAILCIEHWYDVNRDKDTTLLTLLYFTLLYISAETVYVEIMGKRRSARLRRRRRDTIGEKHEGRNELMY